MMQITITLNGTKISPEIEPDTLLIDLVRSQARLRDGKLRTLYRISG